MTDAIDREKVLEVLEPHFRHLPNYAQEAARGAIAALPTLPEEEGRSVCELERCVNCGNVYQAGKLTGCPECDGALLPACAARAALKQEGRGRVIRNVADAKANLEDVVSDIVSRDHTAGGPPPMTQYLKRDEVLAVVEQYRQQFHDEGLHSAPFKALCEAIAARLRALPHVDLKQEN